MNARVCIIGAGPCGLAAVKNLVEAGIEDIVCHEATDTVGGLWKHTDDPMRPSVYDSAHTISSKRLSAYRGFPMPDHYPVYPSHRQISDYFNSYADHFDLRKKIRLKSRVIRAEPRSGGGWEIVTEKESGVTTETADVLIVCNGHHRAPRIPDLKGSFSGEQLHSGQYRNNNNFAGKRVLVVGAGNSGCDIATAISQVAEHVSISIRRPAYIVPKLIFGRPTDVQYAKLQRWPRFLRNSAARLGVYLAIGPYGRYGLRMPAGPILGSHPTLNSELLNKIRHGTIAPRTGLSRAKGHTIEFDDGSNDTFDTIVWAIGYKMDFPFFRKGLVKWQDSTEIPLYLKMIPIDQEDLYFIGLIQPIGCIWALADQQARLAAALISGRKKRPADIARRVQKEVERHSRRFENTLRHAVEVDFHEYYRELAAEIP